MTFPTKIGHVKNVNECLMMVTSGNIPFWWLHACTRSSESVV